MADDLQQRRDKRAGYSTCPHCGNAYFYVRSITLNPNGTAAGYDGQPVCTSCGNALKGPLWVDETCTIPDCDHHGIGIPRRCSLHAQEDH